MVSIPQDRGAKGRVEKGCFWPTFPDFSRPGGAKRNFYGPPRPRWSVTTPHAAVFPERRALSQEPLDPSFQRGTRFDVYCTIEWAAAPFGSFREKHMKSWKQIRFLGFVAPGGRAVSRTPNCYQTILVLNFVCHRRACCSWNTKLLYMDFT